MVAALLVALTLDVQSPPAPAAQELPLKVVVAAPVYQPDGTTSVENVTLGDTPSATPRRRARPSRPTPATAGV